MIKFVIAIVALGGLLWAVYHAGASGEHARMTIKLNAQKAAWDQDVRQCAANEGVLRQSIAEQDQAIRKQAAEDAVKLLAASTKLDAAQRETREAQAVVTRMMKPLSGADTCARVLEVDRRFLETLK